MKIFMKVPVSFKTFLGTEKTALNIEFNACWTLELGGLVASGGFATFTLHDCISVSETQELLDGGMKQEYYY